MRALRKPALLAVALVLAAVSFSCSPTSQGVRRDGDEVSGTGTIRHFTTEGGFYAIKGDDGEVYEPTTLPVELQKDGLRVTFAGRLRSDIVSFHMVPSIVELSEIKRR